jgi:hypothetical protein
VPSVLAKTSRSRQPAQKEQPFYGWRYVKRVGANGKDSFGKVLLTLEDVLHPEEGDYIPQNMAHRGDENYLYDIFQARESRLDRGLVAGDCLIDWGIPGVRNHDVDIAVFDRLKVRPPRDIGTFHVRPSGGRCRLGLEIVSPANPDTRVNDVTHKLNEYHQAHMPLYVIIDQKKAGGPRELLAYSWRAAGFVKKNLDSRGRILIKCLDFRIGLKDNRVVCWDAETDEELGNYSQVDQAKREAEERVKELEAEVRRLQESLSDSA